MMRSVSITTITIVLSVSTAWGQLPRSPGDAPGTADMIGTHSVADQLDSFASLWGPPEADLVKPVSYDNAVSTNPSDSPGCPIIQGISAPQDAAPVVGPPMYGTQTAYGSLQDWCPGDEPDQLGCGTEPTFPWQVVDWSDNYDLTVTADLMIFGRTGLEAGDFVFDAMGNPVLNSANLDFGAQPGARVSSMLGGRVSGWELAFVGFNTHGGVTRVDQPGVVPVFFNAIPADPVDTYDIVSTARLYSFESNFWHTCNPRFRVGAGLRWVELTEVFDVIFVPSPGGGSGFFNDAENRLFGGQLVGGVTVLQWGRLAIDVTGKWGVYNNIFNIDAITQNEELHVKNDDTSYLTELNVNFEYYISRNLSLRAGYTGYWFEDIGLAHEQSNDFDIFTKMGNFDYSSPIYQGGYFGIQARW